MMAPMRQGLDTVRRRDIAAAAVASALGLLLMVGNVADPAIAVHPLAVPLFLAVTVPLLWRGAAPLAAAAASLAGLLVHDLLFGSELFRCGLVLPVSYVYAFTAGADLRGREAWIGLGLSLALIAAEGVTFFGVYAFVFGAVGAAIWGVGRIARSRKLLSQELRAHTAELRARRDERARLEVSAERARLSAELDALLQRALGDLARMAEVGERRAHEPAAAASTLAEIEEQSRQTLEEMRSLVGVLREDAYPSAEPQPTLTHLHALLARTTGPHARLLVEGNPHVLPPAVELSAYRIVEHLLEALDDTRDLEVRVRFADDALELSISGRARRNALTAIERARERARLHHGSFEARLDGARAETYVVLPVQAAG